MFSYLLNAVYVLAGWVEEGCTRLANWSVRPLFGKTESGDPDTLGDAFRRMGASTGGRSHVMSQTEICERAGLDELLRQTIGSGYLMDVWLNHSRTHLAVQYLTRDAKVKYKPLGPLSYFPIDYSPASVLRRAGANDAPPTGLRITPFGPISDTTVTGRFSSSAPNYQDMPRRRTVTEIVATPMPIKKPPEEPRTAGSWNRKIRLRGKRVGK